MVEEVSLKRISLLKRLIAAAFTGLMLAVASAGPVVCQSVQPDGWKSYDNGRYFDHLQKIAVTYGFSGWKIHHLHFETSGIEIGEIDIFRISRVQSCSEADCYFVLFSSAMPNAPFVTACQFKQGGYVHLFNPDGSNFWGFEFACKETLLQVKVTPTHFFPIPGRKTE